MLHDSLSNVKDSVLDVNIRHTKACTGQALDVNIRHTKTCTGQALDVNIRHTKACTGKAFSVDNCQTFTQCTELRHITYQQMNVNTAYLVVSV